MITAEQPSVCCLGAAGRRGGPLSPAFPHPRCTRSRSTAQPGVRLTLEKLLHWLQSLGVRLGRNGVSTAKLLTCGPGELVVIAISAVPLLASPSQKVLRFAVLPIQRWLHRCIKIISVTASMAVVEENAYIWTWGRSLSAELPVNTVTVGSTRMRSDGWGVPGAPSSTSWTHGAELACQVGHSAPGLECGRLLVTFSYFLKHTAKYVPDCKKYTMGSYYI